MQGHGKGIEFFQTFAIELLGTDALRSSLAQEEQVIGLREGEIQIVKDDQGEDSLLPNQPSNEIEGLHLAAQIQIARGLVEKEATGILSQGSSEGDPLSLPTAEALATAVGQPFETEAAKGLGRLLPILVPKDPAHVGTTAEKDGMPDAKVADLDLLRHPGNATGPLAKGKGSHGTIVEKDLAFIGSESASKTGEETGLSGAVRPEQNEKPPRFDLQVETFEEGPPSPGQREISGHELHERLLISRSKKVGAPRNEVSTPTGRTPAVGRLRPRASAPRSNRAPTSEELGRSQRCSTPTIPRAR